MPKPRKAAPGDKAATRVTRATGKKAATSRARGPAGTGAKKVAAPKKLGAVPTGAPSGEVGRDPPPSPGTAPAAVETEPPRPPPPPAPSPPRPEAGWASPSWTPPARTPAPPSYPPPTSPGIDSLAITSMVLGIIALPFFIVIVPAILAIVLGLLGRRNVTREPARGGRGMATAGIVLGSLSLVGAILFFVGEGLSSNDPGESTRYSTLEPADCYDGDFYDERNVDPRLCSEEHNREAFAVLDHSAPPGTEYPGRESLRRFAERECTTRFPAYVGRAYEESRLDVVVVFPPRDAWEEENLRRILCSAARPDDGNLTRSVRDSGI